MIRYHEDSDGCQGCTYCVTPWRPADDMPGCTRKNWEAIGGDCYESPEAPL